MIPGWQIKTVAEIADRCLGKMLDRSKNRGELRPYLRNVNVRWFGFELDDLKQMRFLDEEAAKFTAVRGDVLICEGGYPGRAAIWTDDSPIHFQKAIHRVRFHEPGRNEWFLYYLHFLDVTRRLRNHFTGSGIQHFTGQSLARLPVPLPPLAEQKRIVAILDQAFAAIATATAHAQKNLANARELLGPTFCDILGRIPNRDLRTMRVAEVAESAKGSIRTGPFGSQLLHGEFVDTGVAVLGIDNAVRNRFAWSQRRYITKEKYAELQRYTVRPGDVIITIMGTCGKCAVVPDDIPLAINSKHLCCITLDRTACLPQYFHAYFLHHPMVRAFLAARAKGSIMEGLNMGIIKELPLLLPSVAEQQRITEIFEEVRSGVASLERINTQKLAALDALKQSILHKAFSGELTAARGVAREAVPA